MYSTSTVRVVSRLWETLLSYRRRNRQVGRWSPWGLDAQEPGSPQYSREAEHCRMLPEVRAKVALTCLRDGQTVERASERGVDRAGREEFPPAA